MVAAQPISPESSSARARGPGPASSISFDPETQAHRHGLLPQGKFDAPDSLTSTEVMVASHDGVKVPLSIIHRKDIRLDGSNPTLLSGYGAYGFTAAMRLRSHRASPGSSGAACSPSPTSAAAARSARSGTTPGAKRPSPTPGRTSSPAPSIW